MWTRRLLLGAALASTATGAYGLGVEPFGPPQVTRYALRPTGWGSRPSIRLAALADLHVGAPLMTLERVAAIVAATNALAPDLVVLLGDYAPVSRLVTEPYAPGAIAEVLAGLRAPLGRFAIAGNHEWWQDQEAMAGRRRPPALMRALAEAGLTTLQNRAVPLPTGVWLAGLDSQIAFGRRGGAANLPATLAQVRGPGPVILLAHEPDIFARLPARVAVQLSGHTHGGQVRLLGWSPRVPSRFGNRYAYGHVRENGRDLIVSGGLGTSRLPLRLGVPPEIVLLTLGAVSTSSS